jgi:hypothetical protein
LEEGKEKLMEEFERSLVAEALPADLANLVRESWDVDLNPFS